MKQSLNKDSNSSLHSKHLSSGQFREQEAELGRVESDKEEVADAYFPMLRKRYGGAVLGSKC